MKKTLAIVLALIMVLSVMAMVPASAADKAVEFKTLNDKATLTQTGSDYKLESQGYFGNPCTAGFVVTKDRIDLNDGFTLTFKSVKGFCGADTKDSWMAISFMPKSEVFNPANTTEKTDGLVLLLQGNQQNLCPFTLHGSGNWEQWGSISMPASLSSTAVKFGDCEETVTLKVEKAAADDTVVGSDGFYITFNGTNIGTNDNRKKEISNTLKTICEGKPYIAIGSSQTNVDGGTDAASCTKTTVVFNATVKAADAPAPVTGDATVIYAVVAVIACAVVVGSTVVLKKKED